MSDVLSALHVPDDIILCFFFFFQAEDGIRVLTVTGVQTCALPISVPASAGERACGGGGLPVPAGRLPAARQSRSYEHRVRHQVLSKGHDSLVAHAHRDAADLGQRAARDRAHPGAREPRRRAGDPPGHGPLGAARRDGGVRRLHDSARQRRHSSRGGGRRAGELPRPTEPLPGGRHDDSRPAGGPGEPGGRRGGLGAGPARDPARVSGVGEYSRPASLCRKGTVSDRAMVRRVWCVAAALVAAGACKKSGAGGQGGFGGGGPMGLPVEVAVARTDTVRDEIAATGQIEAVQSIDLRPEVEGRIVEFLVREGQEVDKDTPLFKVDDAQLQAQVAQLAAQRDLAQQALTRTKGLVQQNASSAADMERAEATARSAQAEYDLQRIRLDRTTVRAPFAGVVGQRYVSLGDYVTTSTRLASLHTVNPQRATFQVPERFARLLRPGQEVTFRVAAIPGRDFTGEVDFVDPVVQLPGRTILVKARVPNGQRLLQPGMFIEARLVTAVRANAIVIPEDAVVPLQGAIFVWVVRDGKAERRSVALGVRTPGFVELTSGVEAGSQVVVGGLELLAPGAPVRATVVDRTARGAPAPGSDRP